MDESPVNALVCGVGFIGMALVRSLLARGMSVSVLDHKPCPATLTERLRWFQGDFSDEKLLADALTGTDVAYHLVSSTVPGDDQVGVIKELSDNIFSTIRFIEVAIAAGVKRIVFVSSSSVYGLQLKTPILESAETNPISSHGIHKLAIEKYLLLYRFNHDIDVRIVRLSNPYGPGQNLHGRQGFIAIAIGNVLDGLPVLLRGAGSPVRDFIYIDDVARALATVGGDAKAPAVMNLGTGAGSSLARVVATLEELLGRRVATESGPLRRVDIPVSVLDVSMGRDRLGIVSTTSLRDGLRLTLEHHGIRTV